MSLSTPVLAGIKTDSTLFAAERSTSKLALDVSLAQQTRMTTDFN